MLPPPMMTASACDGSSGAEEAEKARAPKRVERKPLARIAPSEGVGGKEAEKARTLRRVERNARRAAALARMAAADGVEEYNSRS
jgi:hypothetical protein